LYIYSVSSQHDALGSSCSQMLASMTGFIDEKSFENSPVSTFLSMVELYKLKIYVMLYLQLNHKSRIKLGESNLIYNLMRSKRRASGSDLKPGREPKSLRTSFPYYEILHTPISD